MARVVRGGSHVPAVLAASGAFLVLLGSGGPARAQPRELALLAPPTSTAGQRFGAAIATDLYHDALLAGAPGEGAGAVYRFAAGTGGAWRLVQRIVPSSTVVSTAGLGGFGASVSLYLSGHLAVGAPLTDVGSATDAGAVFTFYSGLFDPLFSTTRRFVAPDGAAGDRFGNAVAYRSGYLLAGAPGDDDRGADSGSVYLFDSDTGSWRSTKWLRPGAAAGDRFGDAVAMNDGGGAAGAPGATGPGSRRTGAVEIYRIVYRTHIWKATLTPPASHAATTSEFGAALYLARRGRLVVGAPGSSPGGKAGAGRVFIYTGSAYAGWKLDAVLDGKVAGGRFGASVALGGGTQRLLVVGAPKGSPSRAGAGAVYYFERKLGAGWVGVPQPFTGAGGGTPGDGVGSGVGLTKSDIGVAGAPGITSGGHAGRGGVYLFEDASPPRLDLRADSVTGIYAPGGQVGVRVTACADRPAGPVDLQLFFDGPTLHGCTSTPDLAGVTTFTAAGCQTFDVPLGVLPSGRYRVVFRVDGACKLVEADETNNVGLTVVSAAPSTADITATRFTATVSAGKVTWQGTICQTGSNDARDFNVKLWLDRPSPGGCYVAQRADLEGRVDLPKGGCTSFTIGPEAVPSGTYTSRIYVDADCQVVETSETNNDKAASFTVP